MEHSIPKPIGYIGLGIIFLNAAYITFIVIHAVIVIFETSIGAGLALFLTGIGEVAYFTPVLIAWGGIFWIAEQIEDTKNPIYYWLKLIGGFIGVIIVPYIVFFIVAIITTILIT